MAQDIVSGLFGLSPMQVRQQQQANLAAQAQQFAQQDPFQRATAGMYQAGAGLAQAGAEGLFGMQNPEVVAAQQREALLGQIDMQTPEGILQGAELARQRGDVRMQLQLQQLAQQRKDEIQQAELLAARTKKEEMLAEEQPRLRHEEAMAAIAQRAEAAKMRSEDMRLNAQMRADAMRESNDLKRLLASQKQANLSATEQKELFEADEMVQASQNVQSALQDALKLNDKAYSGYGAKVRAVARSNLPGESEAANATIELDNLMTGQALESLKSTFGAMPTEGERKILLEMQASAEKTPAQRKAIINRAIAMAKRREKINADKAEKLRTGEYARPGGAPSVNKGAVSLDEYLKSQGY